MISIIIPVYNSQNTIQKLVNDITKTLKQDYNYEIVLINDASKDNSEQLCIDLVNKYDFITYLSLSKNFGEHNAVMAGLNNCIGDYAVIMDDDLQHSSEALLKLIKKGLEEKNNYDVIYTNFNKKEQFFFRNFGSKINDLIANIVLKKSKNLYLSSFKFLNRFVVNEIIKYKSPFIYIDGIIHEITNKISSVNVEHKKREKSKSGYTTSKLIQLLLRMFTGYSILPLRFSSLIGIIMLCFGFILSLITFIEKFFYNSTPTGYATILIIIIFFSGTILIILGLIGEYVGRIFLTISNKPQYIVKYKKRNNT